MIQAIAVTQKPDAYSPKLPVLSILNEIAEQVPPTHIENLLLAQNEEIKALKTKIERLSNELQQERSKAIGLEIDLSHAIELLNTRSKT
jgi:hypothetical protein